MADRTATVTAVFEANIGPARQAWEKFVAEVESRPPRIPFSPTSQGATGTTLGGMNAGSVPPSPMMTGAASLNPSYWFNQLAQQVGQAITQALHGTNYQSNLSRAMRGGGGAAGRDDGFMDGAERGLYNRLARSGGSFFAYREANALVQRYQQAGLANESLGRGEIDSALSSNESEFRGRATDGFGHMVRQGIARIPGSDRLARLLGGETFDEDSQREQTEEAIRVRTADKTSDAVRARARSMTRQAGVTNLDALGQSAAEIGFRQDDTDREAATMRQQATSMRSYAPAASRSLEQAAKALEDAAKKLNTAEGERIKRERGYRLDDQGSMDEIASERAAFRPNRAARLSLRQEQDREMRQVMLSNDPKYIAAVRIRQEDERRAQGAEQGREVTLTNLSLSTEQRSLAAELARDPLTARLAGIQGQTQGAIGRLSHDSEYDGARAAIEQNGKLQERLAIRDENDRRSRVDRQLNTERNRTARLMERDPTGAQVEGIVSEGIEQATALRNSGLGMYSDRALANSYGQLDLTRQNYLDQFRGTQLDLRAFDITNPRDQEHPGKVLQEISDGQQRIVDALNALASD
jgi:hypothetical protein